MQTPSSRGSAPDYPSAQPTPTRSWSGAAQLASYLQATAGWHAIKKGHAWPGDIILFDWTSDGTIDHSAIITSVEKNGTIHISQKSKNRHDWSIVQTDKENKRNHGKNTRMTYYIYGASCGSGPASEKRCGSTPGVRGESGFVGGYPGSGGGGGGVGLGGW